MKKLRFRLTLEKNFSEDPGVLMGNEQLKSLVS